MVKTPQTLQQLLEELTLVGLADAQAERNNQPLTQSDIDAQAEEGRVKFAENYATNNDTPEKSLERMRQALSMDSLECLPMAKNSHNGRVLLA